MIIAVTAGKITTRSQIGITTTVHEKSWDAGSIRSAVPTPKSASALIIRSTALVKNISASVKYAKIKGPWPRPNSKKQKTIETTSGEKTTQKLTS